MKISTVDILKQLTLNSSNQKLIHLTDSDVKKVQQKLLEMADDIIGICEDNNLNYHLTGGSTLGAIRHKGFIPWDDDIDIDIERKDYNKLISIIKEKYPDKYYITYPHNTEGFATVATHVRLNSTIVRSCNDPTPEHSGLAFDILVIENTYNNPILRRIHGFLSLGFGGIASCRKFAKYKEHYLKIAEGNKEATKAFKQKIFIGKLVSFLSLKRWILIYNGINSMCKNNNSKYVTVPTGRHHFFGEMYERKDFCEYTRKEFEGRNWKIQKEYDKYLKHMYGDYMKIPDENHREQHVVLDFKIE